jgi:hypothetical protein
MGEIRAGIGAAVSTAVMTLERFPLQVNRNALQQFMRGRIFCGKPVPTFPENALENSDHAAVGREPR